MNIFTSILPNRTLRRAGLVLAAAAMVTAAFAGPVQPARADGSINFPPPLGLYPDLTPISLKATRLNADFVEFAFTVKNQGSYSAKVGSQTFLIIDNLGTDSWTEPQLSPGQAVTHKTTKYMPVSMPLAHHTMGAAVDQNVSVIESNENNNWTQIGFS